MPEPQKSAHFLVLGPLPAPGPDGGSVLTSVLADVSALHEAGHRLDGIFVLGTSGDPTDAKELVLEVQLACLEHQYEPFVTPVPGPGDRHTMPAKRALARDLAGHWEQVAPDLWGGEMTEDIVQPLQTKIFPDLVAWEQDSASTRTGWHPGLLPGDGSLRYAVGERTVGLVCVNTVFRMVADDATSDLAGCSTEQLDLAVGEEFAGWAEHNDLTLMLAGRTGTLPELPREAAPLLALAGSGERDTRGWHLPFEGGAAHLLLRADLRSDRPVVSDTATRRQLPTTVRVRPTTAPPRVPAARQPEEAYDEGPLVTDFYQHMSTGQMVLALVSGPDGGGAIDTDELGHRLAEAVFGAVPQPAPALHETWAAARRQLSPQQMDQHLKALSVPEGHDGRTAYALLRAPWSRVYDFTGSDALPLIRNARAADTVSLVDACEDFPTGKRGALEVVTMHGWPHDGGVPQNFGDAWSVPGNDARSLWFRRFRAELLTRPVVFLSLSPSSSALWETLRIAGRASGEHEFPGFLITPEGTAADRARLHEAGLRHIRATPGDFVRSRLGAGIQALVDGRRVLTEEYEGTRDGVGIVRVAGLVEDTPTGTREFLIGRDPTWGDIKDKKIAPQLSLVDAIEERARPAEGERQPIVLVKGTAGSGKTTALMQVAYRLHRKGMNAGWVDRGASRPPQDIEGQSRQQQFDAIFVDDVDMFTRRAAPLLKTLNNDGRTLVVAAIRVTRQSEIDAGFPAEVVSSDQLLTDDDLKKIVRALDKNALIGKLKQHLFMHQKVAKLREKCDQGLLAAMIEAVTGTSLTQKVESEFQQLKQEQRGPYAVVSFSDSSLVFQQRGIDVADLLEIVSHPSAPDHSHRIAVNALVQMNLLVRTGDGRLRCRQRTIADTVVRNVLRHRKEDLEWVIAKLLLFYAGRAWHITDNQHRDRSAMIKLLNHETMRSLNLDADAVRRIYDAAHQFLQDDHHYWLQRAEYEAEQGRLDLATNHLAAAKGCPDGSEDRLVVTAEAKVRLGYSMQDPANPQLVRAAVHAVHDLFKVATKYRGKAPHAFVVLAREGSRWLEKCGGTLTPQEYVEVLDRIAEGIALGKKCCPENHQVGYAVDEYGPKIEELRGRGPGIPV
ncbi:hypothetical protein [Streptomyces sp. R35]|uniref:Novel STAND NTPase 5 domain-containing protein n=1 Tax=Streptomyces sp. R35 TaxID=3238630 RepID=A0AB39S7E0_9ACTN